jgi:uncharacterized protein (DUF2062 family)/trans-aconitate methyltransferase
MPSERPPRRPLGRAIVEFYYRVRQRELTPRTTALSVGMGTFVGCQPLYGLHLALCFGLARLFGLSGGLAYLAAHISNPWTAPFLLFLEATLGHRVLRGAWLELSRGSLLAAGGWGLGKDLVVGSVLVGGVLGALLTGLAFLVSSRRRSFPFRTELINRTSRRYQALGLSTWETVRAKLRFDPVYRSLLRSTHWPSAGRLVDLGCGRGLLLAAILAAQELAEEGRWPEGWSAPPRLGEFVGVELGESAARAASSALGEDAEIFRADLRTTTVPPSEVIALLDVLHYLSPGEQDDLVARIAGALAPGGLVLIREADASGGLRFLLTRLQERLSSWARLELARRLSYRTTAQWRELLARHGLESESEPMAQGTPFANVLIRARAAAGTTSPPVQG